MADIIRRVGAIALTLAATSVLLFVTLRLLPGDPTLTVLGGARNTDPAAIETLRRELGLEGSILSQYFDWLRASMTGDLGVSYFNRQPVTEIVGGRILPTVLLTAVAMLLAVGAAVPAAVVAATRPGSWGDRLVGLTTSAALASPMFMTGVVLVTLFSVHLEWLPSRGYVSPLEDFVGFIRFLALPSLALAVAAWGPITRFLRSSLEDVLNATYIRTAEGKGLSRLRVILSHALPNASLPALTVVGLNLGSLLGGSVIIEYVFSWPGLGSLIVDSVAKRDYAVLQASVLLVALLFLVTMAVLDAMYGVLDPRLRRQRRQSVEVTV